jgi:hypothetical protein
MTTHILEKSVDVIAPTNLYKWASTWGKVQKNYYRDQVYLRREKQIEDFGNMIASYTSNVLYLEDIVNGNAVERLTYLGYQVPGKCQYKKWLTDNETSNNCNQGRG